MDYSRLIKELRTKLVLTQTEFGELIGTSFISVSRWENGVHEPTTKIKRKIIQLCKENKIELEK